MTARPKQHHYVTRAYLSGFLEPQRNHLFCYGRRRPEPFTRPPEELAKQRNYYSFKRPDGSWDDAIEHLLGQKIESPGLEIVRKLVGGDTRLTWSDRRSLSIFIAIQRMRVPYFREMLDASHKQLIHQLIENYDEKERELGFNPGPIRLQSLGPFANKPDDGTGATLTKEDLLRSAALLESNPGRFSLQSILDLAGPFAKILQHMKWTMYYAPPNAQYLTSDTPVIVRFERDDIKHAGLVRPDCEIRFPLSRTCTLSMAHDLVMVNKLNRIGKTARAHRLLWRTPEIRLSRATDAQVREFNQDQIDFAFRWVFCGVKSDLLPSMLQGESKNVRHVLQRESDSRFSFQSLK